MEPQIVRAKTNTELPKACRGYTTQDPQVALKEHAAAGHPAPSVVYILGFTTWIPVSEEEIKAWKESLKYES